MKNVQSQLNRVDYQDGDQAITTITTINNDKTATTTTTTITITD